MLKDSEIADAFYEALEAATDVPVFFPGTGSREGAAVPESGPWLEAAVMPREPRAEPWDNDGLRLHGGMCRVLVGIKTGAGSLAAVREAEKIAAALPKGTRLGPVGVSRQPWIGGPVVDGDRVFVPLTIPYSGVF